MEKRTIANDITIIYLQAKSFPEGIDEVWREIFKVLPNVEKRTTYFGYSQMQADGSILYRAGTLLLADDDPKKFSTMVIPQGLYASRSLENYMEKRDQFGSIFQELLASEGVDQEKAFCLEWYESQTLAHCMVPLREK